MSRFLFAVTGHTPHVGAHVSIATELLRRGHDVAWSGPSEHSPLPTGVRFYPADDDATVRARDAWWSKPHSGFGHAWLSDLKWLYDSYLLPLARRTLPDAERALADSGATVVVADEHALAATFAARRLGVRWATIVRSAALSHGATGSQWPQIGGWLAGKLAEAQREAGLEPMERPNLSDQLVISISTREFVGPDIEFPPHYRFVGPALDHRLTKADDDAFPWDRLGEAPRVLVSLGTVLPGRGGRLYEMVCSALGGTEMQVILVAPPAAVPEPPSNFVVRRSIPQLAVLPHVRAVVCHGGHNTVLEALVHGLPLVVAPVTLDQPIIAEQVVRCGAGIRVRPGRTRPAKLREVTRSVLNEPRYREAAERLQASFAAGGGTGAAASALEELAR